MKTSLTCLARLSAVFVFLICAQGLRADTVYNAVTGFSNASNPNGVWTYYANGILYTLSQSGTGTLGTGSVIGWSTNGGTPPNNSFMFISTTLSSFSYGFVTVPAGDFTIDPEDGNVSIGFTAPSAGSYTIAGNFLGIDLNEGTHPVEVLDNGIVIFTSSITTVGQDASFNLSKTLSAGDIITFDVGTGSTANSNSSCNVNGFNYCSLATGFNGSVTLLSPTSTPEPGTALLLGFGLLGLILLSRRNG